MILETYLNKLFTWSQKVFGPTQNIKSVTDHIREELIEVEETNGTDPEEWVDIIMLAMDGSHRHAKVTPEELAACMEKKYNICVGRKWPDWRTHPEGEPARHIKE